MKFSVLLLVIIGLLSGIAAAGSDHNHMKLGKDGELVLTEETRIGDFVLPAGTYSVQHKEKRASHWVEFELQPEELISPYAEWGLKPLGEVVARVPCTLEHLMAPAKKTALLAGGEGRQVARLEIKNEAAAHVF